jgi:hypothetical protein
MGQHLFISLEGAGLRRRVDSHVLEEIGGPDGI